MSIGENMSARLEAAVKAWDHHWGDRYGNEALEEMGEEIQVALDAADAVMFSDEAIERGAKAIHDAGSIDKKPWSERNDDIRELYRQDVRMVITALRMVAA